MSYTTTVTTQTHTQKHTNKNNSSSTDKQVCYLIVHIKQQSVISRTFGDTCITADLATLFTTLRKTAKCLYSRHKPMYAQTPSHCLTITHKAKKGPNLGQNARTNISKLDFRVADITNPTMRKGCVMNINYVTWRSSFSLVVIGSE